MTRRIAVVRGSGTGAAVTAALTLLALAAFQGAFGSFFSQDDFAALARASGLLPRLASPVRWLSHQAWFDLMWPLARLDPFPYHVASFIAHVACAILLYWVLRRWLGAPGAFAGAALLAVHPAQFHAVYWIIAIGDSLALGFALAALLAGLGAGRSRWWALPFHALSLLAKESTLALPLVLMVAREFDARRRRPPRGGLRSPPGGTILDPVALSMLSLSIFWVALLALHRVPGEGAAGAPYAWGIGGHIAGNLLTYLGWTAQVLRVTLRGFTDAVDPRVHPLGLLLAAAWGAGALVPALRARGWVAGGLCFGLLLLPVLPLRDHTYHYYLTAPLVAIAWCAGAAFDAATSRIARPAVAGAAALALAVALGVEARAMVREIETRPFVLPELRSDPVIDRARIAERVWRDLGAAGLPAGVRLRFWSPTSIAMGRHERPGTPGRETYWERNVRTALLDGVAVRVLFPQVREVEFVRAFEPAGDEVRYAVYRPDGSLRVGTARELAAAIAQHPEWR